MIEIVLIVVIACAFSGVCLILNMCITKGPKKTGEEKHGRT